MATCSYCNQKAATHTYPYADTSDGQKDYPFLRKFSISVHLCDDCDKLFDDDHTRIDAVLEAMAKRLIPD